MNDNIRHFIKNISITAMGTGISMGILFFVNIIFARGSGPEIYGEYALVLALAPIFILPMSFGLSTATTRFIAQDTRQAPRIICNTFRLTIFSSIFFSSLFFFVSPILSSFFKIPTNIFLWAILFAVLLTFSTLAESIIKGFQKFTTFSFAEVCKTTSIAIIIGSAFFLQHEFTLSLYLGAHSIGIFVLFLVLVLHIPKKCSFSPLPTTFYSYTFFAFLGGMGGFFLVHADRFFLNYFWDTSVVGIYLAYSSAATTISGTLLQIFLHVFFPTVSKEKNIQPLYEKLILLWRKYRIHLFGINICLTSIVIFLYGKNFPFQLDLIILFSIGSVLFFWQNIINWFFISLGKNAIKISTQIHWGAAGAILLLNTICIPSFGIRGAIISTIIVWWGMNIVILRALKQFLSKKL